MGPNGLPKSWKIVELGSAVKLKNGFAFKSADFTNSGIPVIRISNIKEQGVYSDTTCCIPERKIKKGFEVNKGEVLIAMSGATTGKYGIYLDDEPALQNQRVGKFIPDSDKIASNKFIYYLLGILKGTIEEQAYGGAQPNISSKLIEQLKIPLPPLTEQKLIAAKLDALMEKIERAKSRLDRVPELLKNFRQAVLRDAVTGKLTEEWRGNKNLINWQDQKISNITYSLSGFAFKSKDFASEGIQLVRMGNLYNNKLDLSRNPVYLPHNFDKKIINKYTIQKGDILLSLTGTKYKRDYGFAIKVDTDKPLLLNQRIIAIRPTINVDYFLYLLRDNIFRDQFFSNETGGVNQGNVGVNAVLKIKVPVPPLEEQKEIACLVERLFAKADAIEKKYELLRDKVEQLPQAVLGKAFRGELV